MVLQNRNHTMASEQPVKKKLRITDDSKENEADEPDFVNHKSNITETTTDMSCLVLSLPPAGDVNHVNDGPLHFTDKINVNASSNKFIESCVLLQDNLNSEQGSLSIMDTSYELVNASCSRRKTDSNRSFVAQTNSSTSLSDRTVQCENSFSFSTPHTSVHSNGSDRSSKPITSNVYQQNFSYNLPFSTTVQQYPPSIAPTYIQVGPPILQNQHCTVISSSSTPYSSGDIYRTAQHNELADPMSIVSPTITPPLVDNRASEMLSFQNKLIKQCLCGTSESALRKPFQGQRTVDFDGSTRTATLSEWPTPLLMQFLSTLQLLFDVYLKQNNKGFICSRIMDICNTVVADEHSLIDQIIELGKIQNKIVNYLAARVLASFFIVEKKNIDNAWLENIILNLSIENDYKKINFSIEIIKRVVEWKDVDIHVLEEDQANVSSHNEPGVSGMSSRSDDVSSEAEIDSNCTTVSLTDPESFDTSAIKCLIIKSLEMKWPQLVKNIELLITNNLTLNSENCVLNFLSLWESIISVKANLSVVETKPFYAHLERFVGLLNFSLPCIIWRQLLSLFNEVLCYGSTLALQDLLPDETCALAHLIVRYVKDFRLLDCLPYKRPQPVNSFIGMSAFPLQNSESENNVDKTLLQKIVLLVLKSVAITVKETRSDSSDSSVGSDDYDFNQDMQLIERSIRDVLKKLDAFIKVSLEFHPECPFTKTLISLFSDQDDYMIESMVCTLDITVGIFYRNSVFPDLIRMLNPVNTFTEFLKVVSHDSDVLLDYLVSNETCFLLYLLRFLKYVRRNWSKFVLSCEESLPNANSRSEGGGLDATMAVLIRLRLQINRLVSKNLFPYNITPVLRLLETCESFYEGNELS